MSSQHINDSVLAYRLWEISESLLIERIKGFDTLLSEGDSFSSLTEIVSDSEPDLLVKAVTG